LASFLALRQSCAVSGKTDDRSPGICMPLARTPSGAGQNALLPTTGADDEIYTVGMSVPSLCLRLLSGYVRTPGLRIAQYFAKYVHEGLRVLVRSDEELDRCYAARYADEAHERRSGNSRWRVAKAAWAYLMGPDCTGYCARSTESEARNASTNDYNLVVVWVTLIGVLVVMLWLKVPLG